MAEKFKAGDTAYFVDGAKIIQEVQIVRYSGGLYTVRYTSRSWDRPGGFRIRENRLFETRDEAEKTIPQKPSSVPWWYPD